MAGRVMPGSRRGRRARADRPAGRRRARRSPRRSVPTRCHDGRARARCSGPARAAMEPYPPGSRCADPPGEPRRRRPARPGLAAEGLRTGSAREASTRRRSSGQMAHPRLDRERSRGTGARETLAGEGSHEEISSCWGWRPRARGRGVPRESRAASPSPGVMPPDGLPLELFSGRAAPGRPDSQLRPASPLHGTAGPRDTSGQIVAGRPRRPDFRCVDSGDGARGRGSAEVASPRRAGGGRGQRGRGLHDPGFGPLLQATRPPRPLAEVSRTGRRGCRR